MSFNESYQLKSFCWLNIHHLCVTKLTVAVTFVGASNRNRHPTNCPTPNPFGFSPTMTIHATTKAMLSKLQPLPKTPSIMGSTSTCYLYLPKTKSSIGHSFMIKSYLPRMKNMPKKMERWMWKQYLIRLTEPFEKLENMRSFRYCCQDGKSERIMLGLCSICTVQCR